ncbi:MAG: 3-dehydroquinate synthase [Acidobacteriota bacterium]
MRETRANSTRSITITTPRSSSAYEIKIGCCLLGDLGGWVEKTVGEGVRRVVVISNPTIFAIYGERTVSNLKRTGYQVSTWLMKDGERHKSLRSLGSLLQFLSENRLTRSDALVALGGGVVGDLTGFAASVYLRGIPFLQVPTTLLSMIDSSVGGKTGVNTEFGKNLVGAFYQPKGVLIDVETLETLPPRELTAGFCETVKQGALSGDKLFRQTADFLRSHSPDNITEPDRQMELVNLIDSQVSFKAAIVKQDERESIGRDDAKSRKILNFGHTFGHALEKVTRYRRFKHGEAVGHGIIFAGHLSKILELLDQNELEWLNGVVHQVGNLPTLKDINPTNILDAFQFDKKLVSESLQWVLLKKIGQPVILSGKEVPSSAVKQALKKVLP